MRRTCVQGCVDLGAEPSASINLLTDKELYMFWWIFYIFGITTLGLGVYAGTLHIPSIILGALLASPIGFLYHGYWVKGRSLKCRVGVHDREYREVVLARNNNVGVDVIGRRSKCTECGVDFGFVGIVTETFKPFSKPDLNPDNMFSDYNKNVRPLDYKRQ